MTYSYCETVWATSSSPWHIRKLTEKGRMLGGGADTESLCGKKVSWDILSEVVADVPNVCWACEEIWEAKIREVMP